MKLKTHLILGSILAGLACTVWSAVYLLNYSSWQHPAYLNDGIQLFGLALLFFAVPVIMAVMWGIRAFWRAAAASGMTPFQMAIAKWFAMEAVHLYWHEHNEQEAARLTESVMGPAERKDPWA
jgi:hypothetical protein